MTNWTGFLLRCLHLTVLTDTVQSYSFDRAIIITGLHGKIFCVYLYQYAEVKNKTNLFAKMEYSIFLKIISLLWNHNIIRILRIRNRARNRFRRVDENLIWPIGQQMWRTQPFLSWLLNNSRRQWVVCFVVLLILHWQHPERLTLVRVIIWLDSLSAQAWFRAGLFSGKRLDLRWWA